MYGVTKQIILSSDKYKCNLTSWIKQLMEWGGGDNNLKLCLTPRPLLLVEDLSDRGKDLVWEDLKDQVCTLEVLLNSDMFRHSSDPCGLKLWLHTTYAIPRKGINTIWFSMYRSSDYCDIGSASKNQSETTAGSKCCCKTVSWNFSSNVSEGLYPAIGTSLFRFQQELLDHSIFTEVTEWLEKECPLLGDHASGMAFFQEANLTHSLAAFRQ